MDIQAVFCDYCKKLARLTTGAEVYPHRAELKDAKFWKCDPCDAHVGCHRPHPKYNPHGTNPLGRLAKPALRRLRWRAHAVFDPLWKDGSRSRSDAYRLLSRLLGNPEGKPVHIGDMDEQTCRKVIQVLADYKEMGDEKV